ncbi:MAG: DNA repair protein RadA [Leptolyngbya sp. PLA1]|nr:DNA repair protein RadA [Leptolyngbya sp. PLA1]
MAKPRRVFVCRSCGSAHSRWTGKCPDCAAWDSLEESTFDPGSERDVQKGIAAAWGASGAEGDADASRPVAVALAEIDGTHEPATRLPSGIDELDRVLGGQLPAAGLVPGSAVLVGGEPGIGKSTLLLQAARAWASQGTRVLYVSSEESAAQIALRARRLRGPGARAGGGDERLMILADTNLTRLVEQARKARPGVLIIDSIQMIYKPDLPAGPGSVTQLRRCSAELVYLAKVSGMAVVLVGHVTKDGQVAGPRLLEHLVDAVLYFEGDRYHAHRIVRAVKNRFGTTLELGLFEMTDAGLIPLPEGAGLPAAQAQPRPGSAVCPVMSGTRCMLVELQALTATGFLGAAKRKSSGVDSNRLAMLIAVLEQHAGLRLADRDIFASSVGGVRVAEPAGDLALLLAITGAHYKRSLPGATAAVGEVGLGGELRPVSQCEARLREAARLGYTTILAPPGVRGAPKGVTVIECQTIGRAIEHLS